MNLGDLITALESIPPDTVALNGFANPHSYRGYYDQLAFEPESNVTVAAMLAAAHEAVGTTYQGWKGGDYTMDTSTTVWLAVEGGCGRPITETFIRGIANPGPTVDSAVEDAFREALTPAVDEILDAESFMPSPTAIVDNCIAALRSVGLLPEAVAA